MHIRKLLIHLASACFCIYLIWVIADHPSYLSFIGLDFEDLGVRLWSIFFILVFFFSFLRLGFSAGVTHIFEKYNFCKEKWFNITFNLVFGSLFCLFLYYVIGDIKKNYFTPLKNEEIIKERYAFFKEAFSVPQLLEDYDRGIFKLTNFSNLDVRFSCSHPRVHIDYLQNENLKNMLVGQKVEFKMPSYWTFRRTYCCKNKDIQNDKENITVYKTYLNNENITPKICRTKIVR